MKDKFRAIVVDLGQEVRKDLWFFASCGVFVSLLMILRFDLKQMGVAASRSWPGALFSDFVPFNVFYLVFIGLLAVGSIATILNTRGLRWRRLDAAILHLESRLTQIVSAIISFAAGMSVSVLFYSLLTMTWNGAILAAIIVALNIIMFMGFLWASLVARRIEPFDRLLISLLALLLAFALVVLLIVRG